MRQYQYLLIQKAVSRCGYSVANGISHSTLKNRITMMLNNKKSTRKSMLKLLALLPIVGVALAMNAETVNDYVYQQPQKKVVKKGRKDGEIKLNGQTIVLKTDTATVKVEMEKKDHLDKPLFILNGERVDFQQVEMLNSDDIDHIDVLKSEASTAQYGEEGKNGVVIITTKTVPVPELNGARVHTSGIDFKDAKVVDTDFDDVFDVVEQMPEFPGGMESLMMFLAENVCYPEAAFKAGAQGRVLVQFVVDTEGRVNNAKVVKKVNDDLDAEAIRVVGSMPKWKPGMQNGKLVRVRYTLPITFRLK
ncbi:MAG: TonB family protein [Prevotella sp.]|nr:TonB family protein [Prevotella sp.]